MKANHLSKRRLDVELVRFDQDEDVFWEMVLIHSS